MDCQKESEKILRLAQGHSNKSLGTAPGSEAFSFSSPRTSVAMTLG